MNSILSYPLNAADLGRNLLRCLGRLVSQVFHLGRDHGKTLTGFTCPCGLNCGVECKEVRLVGNIRD